MSNKKDVKPWDEEIAEARQKLAEGKAYVKRMREALKIFERNRQKGIPLPGGKLSATGN